jgi:selenide,water dikinase
MGHLLEVCEGSNVSAIVNYSKVPVFKRFMTISIKNASLGTLRNWDSYGHNLTLKMKSKDISYVIHKLVADY